VTWLLTGGAGYIGAHVARALLASGRECVILDNLSTGRRSTVPSQVPLVLADVRDTAAVQEAIREHGVHGVIHLAAKKSAPESIAHPLMYYRENVDGMVSLLSAMTAQGVTRLVQSSSCSVYGVPPTEVVDEDSPLAPVSPYGETKLICEWLIRDVARADEQFAYVMLRYFNVAGAAEAGLGDTGAFNLVPLAFRALDAGRAPVVCGVDYPTLDGSCVRDYVHVADLAEAHARAALRLEAGAAREVYNVGRGEGVSVLEVLAAVRAVTGSTIEPEPAPRRPGDPARIVGSAARMAEAFTWTAKHDLTDMVTSAWLAWQGERAPGIAGTPDSVAAGVPG
jgi:UDP-glucose 4-epimerase